MRVHILNVINIFRHARSLFFPIIIIRTRILFIFIRARSSFFVDFQFFRLYFFVDVSDCFVDVSDCFVDARFYKVGSNATLTFCYLSNMFD